MHEPDTAAVEAYEPPVAEEVVKPVGLVEVAAGTTQVTA